MKPYQLLVGIFIFLFTAVYSTPAAGYFDKESTGGSGSRYSIKDSLQTAADYEQLAHDLYDRKLFKRAITQWRKVLRMQPANAFAMFMLGKSYMGMGKKERGEALCDKAIKNSCY